MRKMILYLLSALDICHFEAYFREEINIVQFVLFLLLQLLDFQTHVPANTTYIGVRLHIVVHFEQGLSLRFEPYIEKHCIFWKKLSTKAIEKPVMR